MFSHVACLTNMYISTFGIVACKVIFYLPMTTHFYYFKRLMLIKINEVSYEHFMLVRVEVRLRN